MGSLLPSLSLSLSLSHTHATKPHLFSPRAAHLTVAHRRATSHIATAANRSRTSPLSRLQFTFRRTWMIYTGIVLFVNINNPNTLFPKALRISASNCSGNSNSSVAKANLLSEPSKNWVKKIQDEWRILEKDLPDKYKKLVFICISIGFTITAAYPPASLFTLLSIFCLSFL